MMPVKKNSALSPCHVMNDDAMNGPRMAPMPYTKSSPADTLTNSAGSAKSLA